MKQSILLGSRICDLQAILSTFSSKENGEINTYRYKESSRGLTCIASESTSSSFSFHMVVNVNAENHGIYSPLSSVEGMD